MTLTNSNCSSGLKFQVTKSCVCAAFIFSDKKFRLLKWCYNNQLWRRWALGRLSYWQLGINHFNETLKSDSKLDIRSGNNIFNDNNFNHDKAFVLRSMNFYRRYCGNTNCHCAVQDLLRPHATDTRRTHTRGWLIDINSCARAT